MFKELLSHAEEVGGLFKGKPANGQVVENILKSMSKIKVEIPEEYLDFLCIADGLFWGGLEFFSSNILVDKKNGLTITDLFSQNKLYQALHEKDKNQKVFLGRTDEENFLYNTKSKKFEIVDEFSNELVKTFTHFEALFEYIIKEQIELIQNYVGFNENAFANEQTEENEC